MKWLIGVEQNDIDGHLSLTVADDWEGFGPRLMSEPPYGWVEASTWQQAVEQYVEKHHPDVTHGELNSSEDYNLFRLKSGVVTDIRNKEESYDSPWDWYMEGVELEEHEPMTMMEDSRQAAELPVIR